MEIISGDGYEIALIFVTSEHIVCSMKSGAGSDHLYYLFFANIRVITERFFEVAEMEQAYVFDCTIKPDAFFRKRRAHSEHCVALRGVGADMLWRLFCVFFLSKNDKGGKQV